MSSVRISMTNETALDVWYILRSTLDAAFGMPDEQWDQLDKITKRLEQKIDFSEGYKGKKHDTDSG